MNLTDLSSHFRFGENWQSFAQGVDETRIAKATADLATLVPANEMKGKSFLDVGCGSGLSMLAALRLGAAHVRGYDIDPDSVEAARSLLSHYATQGKWDVSVCSAFDLGTNNIQKYGVVHSWGVLHHTGDMWRATEACAALVGPGGLFVLALYHKTPFCGMWRVEKRIYAHSPKSVQTAIRSIYSGLYTLRVWASGQSFKAHTARYQELRGMDWEHNAHDWLGGYPYESTLPDEVARRIAVYGLKMERVYEHCAGAIGLFGTGCDEYVARRHANPTH